MSNKKNNQVSRRQFLNYTLTGVGGFMGAALIAPMVGFAVDPLLKGEKSGDFVYVLDVDEITETPQKVSFQVDQTDGWYESKVEKNAFVFYDSNGDILALSPVCTHLGCTVDWATEKEDEFFCPCHDGRYNAEGENIAGTPPTEPLHEYTFKVEEGKLYLSPETHARGGA
ncbi:ubiquinol-cytochrome c reductase iron-sulfur subunit [Allobacillus sp. GCM10007491]|uniref:Menaquinol:cytochrome c reductase iron-sulfur subunit n=2 Tax=Allobacillus TaxID=1400133 RepID=A0A941CW30_9BACI|nr:MULTISPECIES: ubiquinol-cytochrome c reductase iron-sulfur subunit [Allobacillus]MBR7553245.1 ubiquinol-cytochrome c reductase iron-sulfur subunit [Allobacillus saliphilus]TSJ67556.1 ubiquinol-cytochrome c reductase iron-sulfur subunit [Allobacillus salarius]